MTYQDKFVDGDRMFTVTMKPDSERKTGRKARVFVHNWSDKLCPGDVLGGFATALGYQSIYTQRGECPPMDKAWDAYNSIIINSKTADLKTALQRVAEQVPSLKDVTMKFSRTAGCKCGCSPGFILTGGPEGTNIWVDVERGEIA